ncbi:MAG: hypothetical protein KAS23_13430 [Anaerohalosphaera sp.]|nr:hypothetical protein [Anaerohalosphaera sp.]
MVKLNRCNITVFIINVWIEIGYILKKQQLTIKSANSDDNQRCLIVILYYGPSSILSILIGFPGFMTGVVFSGKKYFLKKPQVVWKSSVYLSEQTLSISLPSGGKNVSHFIKGVIKMRKSLVVLLLVVFVLSMSVDAFAANKGAGKGQQLRDGSGSGQCDRECDGSGAGDCDRKGDRKRLRDGSGGGQCDKDCDGQGSGQGKGRGKGKGRCGK